MTDLSIRWAFIARAGRVYPASPSTLIVWTSLSRLFLGGSVSTGARRRFTGRFPFCGDRLKTVNHHQSLGGEFSTGEIGNFQPALTTLLLTRVPIRIIFLVSLIPGLCAVGSIIFLVKEKPRTPDLGNAWGSIKTLPPSFLKFLVPIGLFGISNFAPTLLILRAQDLLGPSLGTAAAGVASVGLYTFSNVIYALVGYPVGLLADKFNKYVLLSTGFFLFGVLCFGFMIADQRKWLLILLFTLSGIYTAIIESSQPALASTLIPEDQHGTGFGVMSSIDGLGDFLSSVTMGIIWTALSPNTGFALAGGLAALAAALLYRLRLAENGDRPGPYARGSGDPEIGGLGQR